jgi:hypothetical protein
MFRSRAVQYLGLVLLVLASLAIIFYPIGSRPEAQEYTLRFTAPKPFEELARADKKNAGKSVSEIADAAFATSFPADVRVPPQPLTCCPMAAPPHWSTAPAISRKRSRVSNSSAARLPSCFPAPRSRRKRRQPSPTCPSNRCFALGNTAVYPAQARHGHQTRPRFAGWRKPGASSAPRALSYTFDKKLGNDADARDAFAAQVRTALRAGGSGLDEADVNLAPGPAATWWKCARKLATARSSRHKSVPCSSVKRIQRGEVHRVAHAVLSGRRAERPAGSFQWQHFASNAEPDRGDRALPRDSLGVSEPLIQSQPPDRIIVQLPGIRDPESAIRTIGTTAQMQIALLPQDLAPVQDPNDPNNTLFRDQSGRGNIVPGEEVLRRSEIIVRGTDVKPNTTAGFHRRRRARRVL